MVAALSLIACGGSGGGTGSTAGTTATTSSTDGTTDGTTSGGIEHPITYVPNATTEYVIVQDGAGAWNQIKKDKATGTFHTVVKDPSGKFAIVTRIGKKYFAYYMTAAEAMTVDNSATNTGWNSVSASISGVPDGVKASVRSQNIGYNVPNGAFGGLMLRAPFTSDLAGLFTPADPAGTRFFAFRDLSSTPSSTPVDIDFNGASASGASAVTLPLLGSVSANYFTPNGTQFPLPVVDEGGSKTVYVPQASWRNANDRFVLTQAITEPAAGGATTTRQSSMVQTNLSGASALPLPAAFSSYSVTTVDAVKKIYRIECAPPAGAAYLKYVLHDPSRIQGFYDVRDMTIYVSPGYFASSTTITTPDLSGFPDLAQYNGTKTTASLVAGYGNRPFSTFLYFRYPPLDADKQPSNMTHLPSLSLGAGVVDAVSRVDDIPID